MTLSARTIRLDPRAVLPCYPAIHHPLGALTDLGGGGGLSGSCLWRFESGPGPLLLRAWPSPGPSRSHLQRVHQWMAEAADLGWIPQPLAGRDASTVQESGGRLWELAPWREGVADDDLSPSRARIAAGFRALASLHRRWERPASVGRGPALFDRLQELEALASRGFTSIGRAVDLTGDVHAESARRWLALAPEIVPSLRSRLQKALELEVARQPCLRDVRRAHFLFLGDRLNGVIDFGAMGEENVAGDVARLLSDWPGDDGSLRRIAMESYESIRPLQPDEHRLIPAFEASAGLLGGAHWLRWHYLEGRTFDDANAVRDGIARGLIEVERMIVGQQVDGVQDFRKTP